MEAFLLFLLVISFLAIGVPIAVALGLSSVLFLLSFSDSSLSSIAQTMFDAFEGHYTLLAIPFFILASSYMSTGGVAQRIIRFAIAAVGHVKGGLAIAGVFACMLFAALSGSSPATVGNWYLGHRGSFNIFDLQSPGIGPENATMSENETARSRSDWSAVIRR